MKHEPIVNAPARPRGEKRRSSWPLLLLVLAVLAALAVVPFWLLAPRPEVYTVRSFETATVEVGPLVEYVRGAGTLVPRLERSLLAPGTGLLADWLVAEGDEVDHGELLGLLDSPELLREVSDREAELAQAERRVAELELEGGVREREEANRLAGLERELDAAREGLAVTRALFELGAASRTELEAAEGSARLADRALTDGRADAQAARASRELALRGAAAAVERAHVAAAEARARAGSLELRAPIAGRVVELRAEPGESVTARSVLATVAATDDLRVEAEFSETQARLLAAGQPAALRVAGADYPGSVARVAQQTQAPRSGQGGPVVPVALAFDEPPAGLRLGASVAVEVEVGRREDALYLPRGPYLTTGGERLAYVVDGGEARRVTVVFGLVDGNRVEVRSGLTAGQRVITSSYEAFKEHETVRLAPAGEARPTEDEPGGAISAGGTADPGRATGPGRTATG